MSRKEHKLAIIGLALAVIGVMLILIFGISAPPSGGNSCLITTPSSSSLPSLPSCELPVGSVALVFLVVGVMIFLAAYLKDR